jgi:hypothetical protein
MAKLEEEYRKALTRWKVIGRADLAGGSNRTDEPAVCAIPKPIRFIAWIFHE